MKITLKIKFKKILLFISGGIDLQKGSNGVGPNSWGWFRIFLPYQKRFYYPALEHDISFSFGGDENDKKLADYEFLKSTLEVSGKNPFAIFFSCIYYIAVANFGHFYFNYQQK